MIVAIAIVTVEPKPVQGYLRLMNSTFKVAVLSKGTKVADPSPISDTEVVADEKGCSVEVPGGAKDIPTLESGREQWRDTAMNEAAYATSGICALFAFSNSDLGDTYLMPYNQLLLSSNK